MDQSEDRFSASDLVDFMACPRKLLLNRESRHALVEPPPRDELAEFVAEQGLAHEQRVREQLAEAHPDLTAIAGTSAEQRRADTIEAMRQGVSAIDQGDLWAPPWTGRPDFLIRVDEGESRFGAYHYQPIDAKLATRPRGEAVAQLTLYSLMLDDVQGVTAPRFHIALGNGDTEPLPTERFSAYVQAAQQRLLEWIAPGPASAAVYPEPVPACRHCDWRPTCDDIRRRDDHVAFLGGAGLGDVAKLRAANVATMAELASLAEDRVVEGMSRPALQRWARQARLQVRQRADGAPHHEVLPDADRGFRILPDPTPGDLFLSIQEDPWAPDGPQAYLWGWISGRDEGQEWNYGWAHDREKEQEGFQKVVDVIVGERAKHPGMHVYHYGPGVRTRLEYLMGARAARQRELDALLRAGVLVDLQRVLRRVVLVSAESYALPDVEAFYAHVVPPRAPDTMDGARAPLYYHSWQDTGDAKWLMALEAYNQAECRSLWGLHQWLIDLRRQHRGARYEPWQEDGPATELLDVSDLLASPEVGRQTLGHLLQYHWREERSAHAALEQRKRATPEELHDDPEAIAHLEWVRRDPRLGDVYRFDPLQPVKVNAGTEVLDAETHRRLGVLTEVDLLAGTVALGRPAGVPHPQHLVSRTIVEAGAIVVALERLRGALDRGGTRYRAAWQVLSREVPSWRSAARQAAGFGDPGLPEDMVARAQELALDLDNSFLAVQGPPGTGKTYLGAQVVVRLLAEGHSVGVMGPSHKVVSNLLEAIVDAAPPGLVRGLQKVSGPNQAAGRGIQSTSNNYRVEQDVRRGQVNLVAGTAWLFAREALDGTLDYLVVDEAGQVPLANALAGATAARNIILLGDPQQLQQPQLAAHPEGSSGSALSHVVGPQPVIDGDRGLFLEQTRRMHPTITRFISRLAYDGRLVGVAGLEQQRIHVAGEDAAGLWYVPVEGAAHNDSASREEAAAVAALVRALRQGTWTDAAGVTRPLSADDILVVAPFNRHVNLLAEMLPDGSRIGTVDKFQGQEAAVAIYTTAAADAQRVGQGPEFLLNLNRLNVAVSRARALAVLVAHPALLASRPMDPAPLAVVNALCALAADASPLPAALARQLPRAGG